MNIPIIYATRLARKKLRLSACYLLLFALQGYGQTQEQARCQTHDVLPLTLHFYLAGTEVNNAYMDNARTLHRLGELLADSTLAAYIDSVNIFSYASPDGGREQNHALALQRSLSVRDYLLRHYPSLNSALIHPRPQGEDWQGMRRRQPAPARGSVAHHRRHSPRRPLQGIAQKPRRRTPLPLHCPPHPAPAAQCLGLHRPPAPLAARRERGRRPRRRHGTYHRTSGRIA